jgi:DNA-binding cell septation regulator SpoVG
LDEDHQDQLRLAFPLYNDRDLKFMDITHPIGYEISRSLVRADFDDDCATDEEMMENSK